MGWFLSLALGPAGQVPSVFLLVFRWGGKTVQFGTDVLRIAYSYCLLTHLSPWGYLQGVATNYG